MAWAESAASRRQLLGQLSGQLAETTRETARIKAAKKSQTRDIFAGLGGQALGFLGEKGLETQRQKGRMELAGEESWLAQQEETHTQNLMRDRERTLETLMQEGRISKAEKDKALEFENAKEYLDYLAGKLGGDWMRAEWGYPPRVGEGERNEMEEALANPAGWVTGMLHIFREKEQLVGALTAEQWAAFEKWGKGMIEPQFPEMPPDEQWRLEFAIDLALGEHLAEPGGAAAGAEGIKGQLSVRRERIDQVNSVATDLQEKAKTLDNRDPLNGIIARLLAEAIPGDMILPGGILVSEEKLNDWLRRANQVLRPSILEQRRAAPSPIEQLQEQLPPPPSAPSGSLPLKKIEDQLRTFAPRR